MRRNASVGREDSPASRPLPQVLAGLIADISRLKDSDVTWLYGPLHTAHVEPVRPLRVSSTVDRLGIDRPSGTKKPILKHRTLSEMLTIPMPSSPILESSLGMEDDFDGLEDGQRPILLQTKSDTNIFRTRSGAARRKSPPRGPFSGKATPMDGQLTPEPSSGKRHISFNTFVEQCMAVDDPEEARIFEEESDDDMLQMRPSSFSSSSRSSRPSLSRSASSSSDHLTIAMIAPTMLKSNGIFASRRYPVMVYAPPAEYRSPPLLSGSQPPQAFDFPSPIQSKSRWHGDDDDEYGSVGLDYFGGPDLGGSDSRPAQLPVQTHLGNSYARAPSNRTPTPPKWRQGPADHQPSSTISPGPNSVNATSPQPQPTRSILKVRPPGTTPPEPASPPSSYFNYNPSPATGIGGMRSSAYEYSERSGPTIASPVIATHRPVMIEEPKVRNEEPPRGRSASRERGSSVYDRSTSRGTGSSGSTTSLSPGSTRLPIESTARRITSESLDKLEEGVSWEPESMEVDYVPERSSTPTPHSSPQVRLCASHGDTSD